MKKQLEQYFGCKVKIAEYKNKLPLPIFMTMRDIILVEMYGVSFAIIDVMKETELSIAAMKKQKAKYEEALQCPVAYAVALNSISMRNALVKEACPLLLCREIYSCHLWELYCRMCVTISMLRQIR